MLIRPKLDAKIIQEEGKVEAWKVKTLRRWTKNSPSDLFFLPPLAENRFTQSILFSGSKHGTDEKNRMGKEQRLVANTIQ
jgi:hypothetical protein